MKDEVRTIFHGIEGENAHEQQVLWHLRSWMRGAIDIRQLVDFARRLEIDGLQDFGIAAVLRRHGYLE